MSFSNQINSIGLLGFGPFGQLVAEHLHRHVPMIVHDPAMDLAIRPDIGLRLGGVEEVAACDLIILAMPVAAMHSAVRGLRPHLRPGAIVLDVGSVKLKPARIMEAELPDFVEIIGTHPLFGPQSAKHGIKGLKLALCPVRGRGFWRVGAFLRGVLGLNVFVVSPEDHDREAAVVQGLTHLIANVLVRMEPLPEKLTTVSFDLLADAVEMVRHDSEGVYRAIEQDNPFAADARNRFFDLAEEARTELGRVRLAHGKTGS